jgi:hypothetical protein
MIQMIPSPESSNVESFGYDEGTQTLVVEFKKGGSYQYFDVPAQVFDAMKAAPSKGQFLAQSVKGTYRYARM